MSQLRLAHPGEPLRTIDLGPSVARFHGQAAWGTRNAAVTGSTFAAPVGSMMPPRPVVKQQTSNFRRSQMREAKRRQREREAKP